MGSKTKTSRRCITLDPDTVKLHADWRKEQAKGLDQRGVTSKVGRKRPRTAEEATSEGDL